MKTILFHANCVDGIFAAYYASHIYKDADLVPVYYQTKVPIMEDHNVICVDFCIDRATLESAKYKSLIIIDHHITSYENMQGFAPSYPFTYVYNVNKCGAMLVWEHYYPGYKLPWILPYIQDRDLWLWQLEKSKEVSACIASYPYKFESCYTLEVMGPETCSILGEALVRYQDKLIKQAVSQAGEIEFEGFKVPIVNSSVLQSEIGNELSKDKPFAIIWWNKDKEKRFTYSLRSDPNGQDVSKICKKYGGGGHKHAGSFSAPWHLEADK